MEEMRKRIKEEFFQGTNIELSDEVLKKFVNDVWRRFLEEDNYYLVMPLSPMTSASDLEKILGKKALGFKIISKDNIRILPPDEMGLIVDIDWSKAEKLYLPQDLFKLKNINVDPNVQGVYSVNSGEGIINSSYESAKNIAEVLDVPFISFDKNIYDSTYEMDYDLLVKEVISNYIIKKYHNLDIDLRDELCLKYANDIISSYIMLKKKDYFSEQSFLEMIAEFIDNSENIKAPKL